MGKKSSKEESLRKASREFIRKYEDGAPLDVILVDLCIETNRAVKPADGLDWSQVIAIFKEEIGVNSHRYEPLCE